MIHRKLFDRFQNLEGQIFVDLCAGSGLIGMEAASRGAVKVFLNENNQKAFLVLKENFNQLKSKFPSFKNHIEIEISRLDCCRWLKEKTDHLSSENVIVFLDPPYDKIETYNQSIVLLEEKLFRGELWLQSDRFHMDQINPLLEKWVSVKKISHGDNLVEILSLKD